MALVQGTDGYLYGTTALGGANGYGTIFKISTSGALTTVHSFARADGAQPYAGVIQATDGSIYGTTFTGGAHNQGTIFKMSLDGTLTTLHSFDGTDGARPICALVQATDGNFYGTTNSGGTYLAGTVFRITPGGTLTTLHVFGSVNNDGNFPYSGLIQAVDGNLYGTTKGGGVYGDGTIFEITLVGILTIIHSFNAATEGAHPYGALAQAEDGDFYGTCGPFSSGYDGNGAVFKLTSNDTLTTIYEFESRYGKYPIAGLVQATDGVFYGSTRNFPHDGTGGTLFKITSKGTLTVQEIFRGNGYEPEGAMLQATDGNFYGTTNGGGTNGDGTVFSLAVGLGPFIKTNPTSGVVGTAVTILGMDLTGATSVSFNGTAAVFTVVSPSEIMAAVPNGATTGKVQVATPGGSLLSDVAFRVTQ
jgi:uncharacterized repeat protein (TIGR03803 family)